MSIATPLSTSSKFITGADGNRVKLAGVSWIGAHQDDMMVGGLDYRHRDDIAQTIAGWGFNHVRLPFAFSTIQATDPVDPATVSANPDMAGMTPWQAYQEIVRVLTAAGLMVIPNAHLMYRGWCCSSLDGNGLWWNANWSYSTFLALWEQVAQTFAGNPLVVAYDIKNEPRAAMIRGVTYQPSWGDGNTLTDYAWLYTQVGNAILAIDPDVLIICEGIGNAVDLTGVAAHPVVLDVPGRVVYSIHDYPQGHPPGQSQSDYITEQHDLAGYITVSGNPCTAPLWVGEVGIANDTPDALRTPAQAAGNGLGGGPAGRGYGNWWANFTAWAGARADLDWCAWHLSGTHRQGTQPSTNVRQYNDGDRCWDGLFAQDWQGPASPLVIEALQAIMAPLTGPGVTTAATHEVSSRP